MNLSIKRKLLFFLALFVLLVIFAGYMVNVFVMRQYYIYQKQSDFIEVYSKINSIFDSNANFFVKSDKLDELCEDESIALLVTDAEGNVKYVYGNQAVLGSRLSTVISGEDKDYSTVGVLETRNPAYSLKVSKSNLTERTYYEMYGSLDDGSLFIVRISYSGMQESMSYTNRFFVFVSLVFMMFVIIVMYAISAYFTKPIRDLSDLSQKMTELDFDAKYTAKRRDEIDILGQNMNEMSEKLKKTISELKTANLELQKDIDEKIQIDEQRKEFLSNVSHELKTPISLIQGYAEGLKEGISDDEETKDYYLEVIIDEASKMNNIVKKLLSLNQIEFGNYHVQMERFDIVEVINGMLFSSEILLKQKDISVVFDAYEPVNVWADEFQIEEVINNYLSNAINHVSGERLIRITIDLDNPDVARINVFNTGEYIPEEEIENLWDKFYKVDKARTREYGGSGLGLSIVKAIMESMNQKYGVYNTEDGVLFWFEVERNN